MHVLPKDIKDPQDRVPLISGKSSLTFSDMDTNFPDNVCWYFVRNSMWSMK